MRQSLIYQILEHLHRPLPLFPNILVSLLTRTHYMCWSYRHSLVKHLDFFICRYGKILKNLLLFYFDGLKRSDHNIYLLYIFYFRFFLDFFYYSNKNGSRSLFSLSFSISLSHSLPFSLSLTHTHSHTHVVKEFFRFCKAIIVTSQGNVKKKFYPSPK